MSLRVPTSSLYTRLERGLDVSLDRVSSLQTQLGTGSRISKLSDDPVGASTGLRLRSQESDWSAYQRTADDATAALGTTDGALQTSSSLLRRVKELAISAVSGALGASENAAIGAEIADLRSQLADVANTEHLGRAVFGGHQPSAVAKDPTTGAWTYAGDGGTVSRQVSPSVTLKINLDGKTVFGFSSTTPPTDVFSVLDRLEASVRSGNTAATSALQSDLKVRSDAIAIALGQVGASMNRVDSATELGKGIVNRLVEQRSQVEDVDIAQVVMRLQAAQNGYQASLGAVSRADLPSLANFLK